MAFVALGSPEELEAVLVRAAREGWEQLAIARGEGGVGPAWVSEAHAFRVGFELEAQLERVTSLAALRSLALWNIALGDEGAARVGTMRELRRLELWGNGIGARGAATLTPCTRLRALTMIGNPIGDEGVRVLCGMSTLRTLELAGAGISPDGTEALARLARLEVLGLRGNGIGSRGAARLWRCPSVRVLDVSDNGIDGGGVSALVGMCTDQLEAIELEANRVGESGLRLLLDALVERPGRLRVLNVDGNPGTAALAHARLETHDARAIVEAYRRG